jgi:hypothetical protein
MRRLSQPGRANLPPPQEESREWLMGVPTYDGGKDYRRPDVEAAGRSLKGIPAGLRGIAPGTGFRGVAVYAPFTTGEAKWAVYGRLWPGRDAFTTPPPDPRYNPTGQSEGRPIRATTGQPDVKFQFDMLATARNKTGC